MCKGFRVCLFFFAVEWIIFLFDHLQSVYLFTFMLKAYSLISYRERSQKFQNLNFLHLFVAFLQEGHFPKGI